MVESLSLNEPLTFVFSMVYDEMGACPSDLEELTSSSYQAWWNQWQPANDGPDGSDCVMELYSNPNTAPGYANSYWDDTGCDLTIHYVCMRQISLG